MENIIMKEIRDIRKKLSKEYLKNPEIIRARFKKIEEENKYRLVKGVPKYLKKTAA